MSLFLYQQSLQSIGEVKVNPLSFTLLQPSPIKSLNILMLTHIRMFGVTPYSLNGQASSHTLDENGPTDFKAMLEKAKAYGFSL